MAMQTIYPMNGSPTATFYLGHFAEGAGEHYVCLADESRDETISVLPNTENSFLSPAQEEQAQLDSTSDINMKEDQSHNNIDQHAPDVSTTYRNRTGLESQSHSNKDPQHVNSTHVNVNSTHENEEQDMSNQCAYQKRGKDNASQLNGCNTDYGPYLNPDILENIIKTTVGKYPQMRQTLRAVSRFFQRVVDTLPFPQVYIPELAEVANIRHLSVRKIINMKGKNSAAVIALRNIINSKNWTNAWVSLVAYGYGWYVISKILENWPQLRET